MVAPISSSTISNWSDALFSKLDSKKQGYIDKAELQSAFSQTAGSTATATTTNTAVTAAGTSNSTATSTDTSAADKLFATLDSDSDGKISKSELSAAINKVASDLNAQYDQSRVDKAGGKGHQGPPPGGGGHPPGGGGGPPAGGGTGGASGSSSNTYIAAADTNGDGKVSAEEEAAYEKLIASGSVATSKSSSSSATATASAGVTANASLTSLDAAKQADVGFTKDELTAQLKDASATDSRRAGFLSKLIDNFSAADTNGDGKVNGAEVRALHDKDGPPKPGGDPSRDLAHALELLKAYVTGSGADTTTSTAQSVSVQA